MKQTRNYGQNEEIVVGDVVQVYDGSFGDAIVEGFAGNNGDMIWFYRPYMRYENGNWESHIEIFSVSERRVREMPVYVTGIRGKIENRAGKR